MPDARRAGALPGCPDHRAHLGLGHQDHLVRRAPAGRVVRQVLSVRRTSPDAAAGLVDGPSAAANPGARPDVAEW